MWNEYDDDDDGEHLERRRWSVPSRRELTPPRTTRLGTLNDEPPTVEDLQTSTTEPSVATMAPVAQPKARATAAATAVSVVVAAADRQMSDGTSKTYRAALETKSSTVGRDTPSLALGTATAAAADKEARATAGRRAAAAAAAEQGAMRWKQHSAEQERRAAKQRELAACASVPRAWREENDLASIQLIVVKLLRLRRLGGLGARSVGADELRAYDELAADAPDEEQAPPGEQQTCACSPACSAPATASNVERTARATMRLTLGRVTRR